MDLPHNGGFSSQSGKSLFNFMIPDQNLVNTINSGMFAGDIQTGFTQPISTQVQDQTMLNDDLNTNVDMNLEGVQSTLAQEYFTEPTSTENSGIKKRKRRPKNCSFCRRRKLKCDRQHPCSNCVKRKIESTCSYANDSDDSPPLHVKVSPTEMRPNGSEVSPSLQVSPEAPKAQTISRTMSFSSHRNSKQRPPQTSVTFSDFSEQNKNRKFTNSVDAGKSLSSEAIELKKRLDKMEKLVLSMMMEKNQSNDKTQSVSSDTPSSKANSTDTTPTTDSSPLSRSTESESSPKFLNACFLTEAPKQRDVLGMLKLDKKGKSIYHGDSHWGILFNEMELLEELMQRVSITTGCSMSENPEDTGVESQNLEDLEQTRDPIDFPFMNPGSSGMSPLDVLATIPARPSCDILIERYFLFCSPCFQIIHRPTFEKEYNDFWENPTSCELIWVSMFLGMMTLALQSYCGYKVPEGFQGDGNPEKIWKTWMSGSEVCSYWGKIGLKPGLNNVRAIILWILGQASQRSAWDWPETVSPSVGILVRISQSMGLHRDPKWFAMSSFEAESRRKVWMVVQYLDTHMSMVQGLPTIISPTGMDVDPPANINDKDLTPENVTPAVSSPFTNRTDMIFTICRNKIMKWSALVLDLSSSVGPHAMKMGFEKTLDMHALIRKTFLEAPEYLSTSVLKSDTRSCPPDLLLQRVWYEVDYIRLILTLHRQYGAMGMVNIKYRRSREEALSASIRLMYLMEWCFGNEAQLVRENYNWIIGNVFMSHFLNATIYLSLALLDHYDTFTVDQRIEQIRLVKLAGNIFKEIGEIFSQFKIVSFMVGVLLDELNRLSRLTHQQRVQLREERKKRRMRNDYTSAFGIDSGKSHKGLTVELNANDSEIRFNKLFNSSNPLQPWDYSYAMANTGEKISSRSTEYHTDIASPKGLMLNDVSLANTDLTKNEDLTSELLDSLYSVSYF
jgi:hypothetical protein